MKILYTLIFLLVCQGFIHAQDTVPPTIKAKSQLFIELDAEGRAVLTPDQVNNGSFDNVTSQANLQFSLSQTIFNCVDMEIFEEWQFLGEEGVSSGDFWSAHQSVATSSDGTLYVAYRDHENGNRTTVKRWDGNSWQVVGEAGISDGVADDQKIAVARDGSIFVAYRDYANSYKTTVLKWDGNSWQTLGLATNSFVETQHPSLSISPEGRPFIAFKDGPNGERVTVLQWEENRWEAVGGAGISSRYIYNPTLAFAPDGTPYVAFVENGEGNKVSVLKWNGSSWERVGDAGISLSESSTPSMVVSKDGTPFVAFQDFYGNGNFVSVLKWNGNNWESVGGGELLVGESYEQSLKIDRDGILYLAYKDNESGGRVSVRRWNGDNWEVVGAPGISSGAAVSASLAISEDGVVNIGYIDQGSNWEKEVQQLYQSNRVRFTVTDNAGNSSTTTAIVKVVDERVPTVAANNITLQLDEEGAASLSVEQVNERSSDNCGLASLSLNKETFSCADLGSNVIMLTGKDYSGNTSIAALTVTVEDRVKPVLAVQDVVIQLDEEGNATLMEADAIVSKSDNCSAVDINFSRTSFNCTDVEGPHTVTVVATDPSGNRTEKTVEVRVMDEIPPTAKTQNISVQLDVNGKVTIMESDINAGSSDNCGIASMSLSQTNFSCADVGSNTVVLTLTDVNGNTASATAAVTVVDNLTPEVSVEQLFTIEENSAQGTAVGNILVSDNCHLQNWAITGGNTGDAFTINTNGLISVNKKAALNYESGTEFNLEVSVEDMANNADTATVTVRLSNMNEPPVLAAIQNRTVNENELLSFTVSGTDPDGTANLQYSLGANAPEGASINAATGEFTWTPSEEQGFAVHSFSLRITDGVFTAEQVISIDVLEVNQAPVITSEPILLARAGEYYSYQFQAADPDLPANILEFDALVVPSWLNFDLANQVLSGIPENIQEGNYLVKLQVSDGAKSVLQEFSISLEKPTGIFDNEQKDLNALIYPNPTSGRIIIKWEDQIVAEGVKVYLSDLGGRMLVRHEGDLNQISEEVSAFLQEIKAGVFLLQLKAGERVKTVKLIKE